MLSQLKSLSKDTLIYGASTIIGRFLNFLLVPFYVNVLHSASEYGISTSLYTYLSFFMIIYTLGLEAAYFRYAARGEKEQRSDREERDLFSAPFLAILIFGGLLSAVVILAAPLLAGPVFHDPRADITRMLPMLTSILRYGALIVLLDSLSVVPFALLRLEQKAKFFALLKLLNIVVTIVLNFIFILGFHWGVAGIFRANLIASALNLLLLMPTIIRRFRPAIDRNVLRKLLPFGLTNVPANLSAMMVQVIDRPLVQNILGLGVLGIYQANYRLGFVMMVFVSLFEYAWRPFFLRQARTDDARARLLFSRVFTYFMFIALIGFLGLTFALPYLVSTPLYHGRRLLKPEYLTGMSIIPVVLFAYVFQGMYTNFIAGIYIKEHNKVLPFITGLGALVNIVTNILLIPRMGIMGAALATLFAYIAMAGSLYIQAQKVYPIPYDWARVGTLFATVGIAYALERALILGHIMHGEPLMLLTRAAIFIAAIAALFVVNFFTPGEKKILRGFMVSVTPAGWATAFEETGEAGNEPVERAKENQRGS
jgi:O-antigen/teichoic acid export membrane protein